jgi:hypothetical protein
VNSCTIEGEAGVDHKDNGLIFSFGDIGKPVNVATIPGQFLYFLKGIREGDSNILDVFATEI